MIEQIAITINSLTKTYKLYHHHRDRIKELLHPLRKVYHYDFHALSDFNITIGKGEVIGIIGQNGSGKSTLLKILASVVTPSSGSYKCNGRVTALLELGGGFNNETSGIENIYFLGGLQGYTKKEMQQRLQKILEFADIGVYADQPVHKYSSGMYVRLAFSIAINIDPDILIIDEALSVGDIRFQQKCFRKIKEFKEAGKTILFCSHNLSAVRDFCTRAIWLNKGRIVEQGNPIFISDRYNAFMTTNDPVLLEKTTPSIELDRFPEYFKLGEPVSSLSISWDKVDQHDSFGVGGAKIQCVSLYNVLKQSKVYTISGGEPIRLFIQLLATRKIDNPIIAITLNGRSGVPVFRISNHLFNQRLSFEIDIPTIIAADFTFPPIGNGRYTISLGILDITKNTRSEIHWIHDAIILEVSNPDNKYKMGTLLVIEEANIRVVSKFDS